MTAACDLRARSSVYIVTIAATRFFKPAGAARAVAPNCRKLRRFMKSGSLLPIGGQILYQLVQKFLRFEKCLRSHPLVAAVPAYVVDVLEQAGDSVRGNSGVAEVASVGAAG